MMTQRQVANAIMHGRPGEPFNYTGDGTSIDGLNWQGVAPTPTWDDVQTWAADLAANPPAAAPTLDQKLADALAALPADQAVTGAQLSNLVSILRGA